MVKPETTNETFDSRIAQRSSKCSLSFLPRIYQPFYTYNIYLFFLELFFWYIKRTWKIFFCIFMNLFVENTAFDVIDFFIPNDENRHGIPGAAWTNDDVVHELPFHIISERRMATLKKLNEIICQKVQYTKDAGENKSKKSVNIKRYSQCARFWG